MDAAMTEWRGIPGCEDRYEVSDDGQVRTLPRMVPSRHPGQFRLKGQRILRPQLLSTTGYLYVTIFYDAQTPKKRTIHTLVAEAFLGPRPDGMQVCHEDGERTNNVAANLRYDTPSANAQDSVKHGTHRNTRLTKCKNGHEFTPENTIYDAGNRRCKTCRQSKRRERYLRDRAA